MFFSSALLLVVLAAPAPQDVDSQDPAKGLAAAEARLEELGDTPEDASWRTAAERRIELLDELIVTRRDRAALPTAESVAVRLEDAQAAVESLRNGAAEPVVLEDADNLGSFQDALAAAQAREKTAESSRELVDASRSAVSKELETLPDRKTDAASRASIEADPKVDELGAYRVDSANLEASITREREEYLLERRALFETQERVLDAEVERARLLRERAETRLAEAREQAGALREAEAEEARREAEAMEREAERQRDPLRRFRNRVAASIATSRAQLAEVGILIQEVAEALETEKARGADPQKERERLERRLQLRGEGGTKTLDRAEIAAKRELLLTEEALLPRLYESQALNQDLLAETLDRLWKLQLPQGENEELDALVVEAGEGRAEEAAAVFGEMLAGPEGLLVALGTLQAERERLDDSYADLEALYSSHAEQLTGLRDFIVARRRWVRGSTPLNQAALGQAGSEARRFADLVVSAETGPRLVRAAGEERNRLLPLGAGLAALVLFGFFGRRRRSSILSGPPTRGAKAVFEVTLALLLACDIPFALWLIATFIESLQETHEVDAALTQFLFLQALALGARRVLRAIIGPRSLSVRSAWVAADVAGQLMRSVRLLTLGAQLFWLPQMLFAEPPFGFTTLPRFLEVIWMGCILLSILLLLLRHAAIGRRILFRAPWLRGTWSVVVPLLVLAAVGILLLFGLGFEAGARHVVLSTSRSVAGIGFLIAAYMLLRRALEHLAQTASERLAIPDETETARTTRSGALRVTARLVTVLVVGATAVGLQQAWGTGEFLIDLISSLEITTLESGEKITGFNVGAALLWILVGHLLSVNLGRLFENVVAPLTSQRTHAERYAWLTLTRYGIVAASWTGALLALGVDLSMLGWLLTAVSVGLGFGLQEVVANFVSGLILLFEQPIRVGDVITVGQTGGTVDRITIRSTVVTNWERQTIIVPNKKLITQDLTNWTRQDQTVRRKLKVGVARDTDVEQVMKLLDSVVRDHPGVMVDPPHRVWFEGYGGYTLEFELWFYSTLDDGLRVRTELYTKLVAALEEAGIEVPLPQHEVRMEREGVIEPTLG